MTRIRTDTNQGEFPDPDPNIIYFDSQQGGGGGGRGVFTDLNIIGYGRSQSWAHDLEGDQGGVNLASL